MKMMEDSWQTGINYLLFSSSSEESDNNTDLQNNPEM